MWQAHVAATPLAPSERLRQPVSPELEHAILACLEKSRAKCPQTARDLANLLERVPATWSLDEAEAWWSRYERGQAAGPQAGPQTVSGETGSASSGNTLTASQTNAQPGKPAPLSSASLERTTVFQPEPDESG